MKKYLLLFSVSILATTAGRADALTAAEQLQSTKEIFVADFQKMDDNKDGQLSMEEYLSHQFENFRANIIEAEGFDVKEKAPIKPEELKTESTSADKKAETPKDELQSLSDVNKALQEMANFDIDFEEDMSLEGDWGLNGEEKPEETGLTKADVMPEMDILSSKIVDESKANATEEKTAEAKTPEEKSEKEEVKEEKPADNIDLSVSEDDNLKQLLAEINETPEEKAAKKAEAEAKAKAEAEKKATEEKAAAEVAEREQQISGMLNTIKKTLPKKIDGVTTWVDIEYKDNVITYVYEADIDTSKYTEAEKKVLSVSIEKDACSKAYVDMCPKIKPTFIDKGTNMKIRYQDKGGNEFGKCEFNQETCK